MVARINKTSICSIVFLDIIDYSKKSGSEQNECKDRFNSLILEAVKDIAQTDRIILDTGDGASIALLGAPEEALFVSITIRNGMLRSNQKQPNLPLNVRIGINLGPVRVVKDINNHLNIIGDGINVAQRVMSFAEPNQILVSRSYFEVVSRLTNELTQMFTYYGVKHDKHVREHEVYIISVPGEHVPALEVDAVHVEAPPAAASERKKTIRLKLVAWIGGGLAAIVLGSVMLSGQSKLPDEKEAGASSQASNQNESGQKSKLPDEKEAGASSQASNQNESRQSAKPIRKKFTESVKKGYFLPACSDAQRSMMQCK